MKTDKTATTIECIFYWIDGCVGTAVFSVVSCSTQDVSNSKFQESILEGQWDHVISDSALSFFLGGWGGSFWYSSLTVGGGFKPFQVHPYLGK